MRADNSRARIDRDAALVRVKENAALQQEADAVEKAETQERAEVEVAARTAKRRGNNAARRLQAVVRGRDGRVAFLEQRSAAVLVQAHQRRRLAQSELGRRRVRRDAATVVQRHVRGWESRRYRERLALAAITAESYARGGTGRRAARRRLEAICYIQACARGQRGRALARRALSFIRRRHAAAHTIQCAQRRTAQKRRMCVAALVIGSITDSGTLLSWSKAMESTIEDDAARVAEERVYAGEILDGAIEEVLIEHVALAPADEAFRAQLAAEAEAERLERARVAEEERARQVEEAAEKLREENRIVAEIMVMAVKRREYNAAVKMQALVRCREARVEFARQKRAAVLVQSDIRRRLAHAEVNRVKERWASTQVVQAHMRGWLFRKNQAALVSAVKTTQSRARGSAARRSSRRRQQAATPIQATFRGWRVRLTKRRASAKASSQQAVAGHAVRLEVSVLECRGLPRMDRFGKNDVFVTLEVGGQKQRTCVVDGGGAAPVWADGEGEQSMFELASDLENKSMLVCAFDEDIGSNDFIGRCLVQLPDQAADRSMTGEWYSLTNDEDKKGKNKEAGAVKLVCAWSFAAPEPELESEPKPTPVAVPAVSEAVLEPELELELEPEPELEPEAEPVSVSVPERQPAPEPEPPSKPFLSDAVTIERKTGTDLDGPGIVGVEDTLLKEPEPEPEPPHPEPDQSMIQQLNSFGEGASALAEANSQQTGSLLLGDQSGAVAVTSQLVHELVALQQRSHEQLLSQQQEIRDLAAELAAAKVNEERQRWEWEMKQKAETTARAEVALAAALEAKESAETEAAYAREEVEELKDELQQRSSLTVPSPEPSGDADVEAVADAVPPPAARARSPAHAGRRSKRSPARARKTATPASAGHKPWAPPTAAMAKHTPARKLRKNEEETAAELRPQSALPYLQEPDAYAGDAVYRVVAQRRPASATGRRSGPANASRHKQGDGPTRRIKRGHGALQPPLRQVELALGAEAGSEVDSPRARQKRSAARRQRSSTGRLSAHRADASAVARHESDVVQRKARELARLSADGLSAGSQDEEGPAAGGMASRALEYLDIYATEGAQGKPRRMLVI